MKLQRRALGFHAMTIAIAVAGTAAGAAAQRTGPQCEPAGPVSRVSELVEGSGVAASRRHAGRFWAHNDSGDPVLFALDATGRTVGQVRVNGAKVEDWEAIATGPCAGGSCLFIGDIGDNDAERDHVTIYRVPEPDALTGSVSAGDAIRAKYPDGAQDAEAMFVTTSGDLFIVTKGETGPSGVYRLPRDAKNSGTITLERIGETRRVGADDRITDGAISPDGNWVVLRSTGGLQFHAASDLMAGTWREASRVALSSLGEPQGEGVAFVDARTLVLVGEGGGKSQPGTFARLTCAGR